MVSTHEDRTLPAGRTIPGIAKFSDAVDGNQITGRTSTVD
jgi:hypothetical protein